MSCKDSNLYFVFAPLQGKEKLYADQTENLNHAFIHNAMLFPVVKQSGISEWNLNNSTYTLHLLSNNFCWVF